MLRIPYLPNNERKQYENEMDFVNATLSHLLSGCTLFNCVINHRHTYITIFPMGATWGQKCAYKYGGVHNIKLTLTPTFCQ